MDLKLAVMEFMKMNMIWEMKYVHEKAQEIWNPKRHHEWWPIYSNLVTALEQHLSLRDQYLIIRELNLQSIWLSPQKAQQLIDEMMFDVKDMRLIDELILECQRYDWAQQL